MDQLNELVEFVIAVNDDKSFPDITVRVQTDLMSLTQH